MATTIKDSGKILIAEPKIHVSTKKQFAKELDIVQNAVFDIIDSHKNIHEQLCNIKKRQET